MLLKKYLLLDVTFRSGDHFVFVARFHLNFGNDSVHEHLKCYVLEINIQIAPTIFFKLRVYLRLSCFELSFGEGHSVELSVGEHRIPHRLFASCCATVRDSGTARTG